MSEYDDLVNEQKAVPKIDKDKLGGWATVAQAYREMRPDVSYGAFRARIIAGKSAIEAGTMPRSNRGRSKIHP